MVIFAGRGLERCTVGIVVARKERGNRDVGGGVCLENKRNRNVLMDLKI